MDSSADRELVMARELMSVVDISDAAADEANTDADSFKWLPVLLALKLADSLKVVDKIVPSWDSVSVAIGSVTQTLGEVVT